MAAFTLQHSRADKLAELKADLSAALRALTCDREYTRLKVKLGIVGTISAFEVTFGAAGWHPHRHCLFVSERALSSAELAELSETVSRRYIAILKRRGRYAMDEVAVVFSQGDRQTVADYVVKEQTWNTASEMTKAPVKKASNGGASPFELLERSKTDDKAARLFQEYYRTFKGTHQLQYSRGLRALLGLTEQAKTDAELAAQEDEGILLVTLSRETWRRVCELELRGPLLEAAECQIYGHLEQWLAERGLSPGPGYQ